jgi:GNAT superfamily N-acetyltransferase
MGDIEVLPARPDDWSAIEAILGGDGEKGCWCQAWRGVYTTGETRRGALTRQLATEDDPPPGFLAWLDGEAVGWAGVGLRTRLPRLARSRTIPSIDDAPAWCIGCFKIRPGYRRRGVATALLEGVVAAARAAGAPCVEAWPIDPGGRRVDTSFAFVGLASMFDRVGFRRVMDTGAHSAGLTRILVRKDLDPGR